MKPFVYSVLGSGILFCESLTKGYWDFERRKASFDASPDLIFSHNRNKPFNSAETDLGVTAGTNVSDLYSALQYFCG